MVSDPYKVLGVSRNASQDEIKKAYRKLARQYHPDMHPNDPNASAKMNEINEAYDILTNPTKYARYRQGDGTYSDARGNGAYGGYNQQSSGYSGYSQQNSGYQYRGYNGYNQSNNQGYNQSYGGQNGWNSNFYGFDFSQFFNGGYAGGGQTININPQAQASDSQEIKTAINYINSKNYSAALQTLARVVSSARNARWYYICSLAYYGNRDMAHAVDYIRQACTLEPSNQSYQQLYNQMMQASRTESYSNPNRNAQSSGGSSGGRFSSIRAFLPIIIVVVLFFLMRMSCYTSMCYGYGCNPYYRSYYTQDQAYQNGYNAGVNANANTAADTNGGTNANTNANANTNTNTGTNAAAQPAN